MSTVTDSRQKLRTELRARRRGLSTHQQAHASHALLHNLMSLPLFMRSQHIALYWAVDGEIDVRLAAKQLWKMGKNCYLPVVHPTIHHQMWFLEYSSNTPLTLNRFKIPEPVRREARKFPPELLDIVLLPIVGFDITGARLGMGGGFYDATFSFTQTRKRRKPWLLGVAHSCQQVATLATAIWDIPMHSVVTEKDIFRCNTNGEKANR